MIKDLSVTVISESLLAAVEYIGNKVYSTPYTNTQGSFFRANFYYTCADGQIIYRPNHSISEVLRSIIYLDPIVEYYKINGTDEVKELLHSINHLEMEKIRILLLFFTSGRENEQGHHDNPGLYAKFRTNARDHVLNYFVTQDDTYPFSDQTEVAQYANLLTQYDLDGLDSKSKAIVLLLRSSHSLNLLRCSPHKDFQRNINNTFNEHSRYKDTRNLQSLIYYAQNCTIAVGDKLRTKYEVQTIHGCHTQQGFTLQCKPARTHLTVTGHHSILFAAKGYDEQLFSASCRTDKESIKRTIDVLDHVQKPIFYQLTQTDRQFTIERAKQVIAEGNGVIRIMNGRSDAISLRLEAEQLANPKLVRPIRRKKLRIDHTGYIDLISNTIIKREEKDDEDYLEQSLVNQSDIIAAPCNTNYQPNKKISKQENRGKPKNTIYAKKKSYTLLPSNGRVPLFQGTYQDRLFNSYLPVGTLYNLNALNRKGDRYCWKSDVRTSGIGGYFWLTRGQKNKKIATMVPDLDIRRQIDKCSIDELKEHLKSQEGQSQTNELLVSASLLSLEAVFASKDKRLYRIAALHARTMLAIDYGIKRPLLIIDGTSAPKEYTVDQIKKDLTIGINKYRKWYWRLFTRFIKHTMEYTLLLNLIEKMGTEGIDVDVDKVVNFVAREAETALLEENVSFSHRLKVEIDQVKLRRCGVYFSNLSVNKVGPQIHGFVAAGYPGMSSDKDIANVYSVGESITHARYAVTTEIARKTERNRYFPEHLKQSVHEVKNTEFDYVEYFLKMIYTRYFELGNYPQDEILALRIAFLQSSLNDVHLIPVAASMLERITDSVSLAHALVSLYHVDGSHPFNGALQRAINEQSEHQQDLQTFVATLYFQCTGQYLPDTIHLSTIVALITHNHNANLDQVAIDTNHPTDVVLHTLLHHQKLAQFFCDLHRTLIKDIQTENHFGRILVGWNTMPKTQMPLEATRNNNRKDRAAFEKNGMGVSSKRYQQVSEEALRQSHQQSKLHMFYLEEKEGIGKSCSLEDKIKKAHHKGIGQRELFGLTEFQFFPSNSNPNIANCNKSNGTLLQAAALLDARKQNQVAPKIGGSSCFAMGSKQRYSWWDPVRCNYTGRRLEAFLGTLAGIKSDYIPAHLSSDLQHINLYELAQHKHLIKNLADIGQYTEQLDDPSYLLGQIMQIHDTDILNMQDAAEGMGARPLKNPLIA